MTTRDATVPGTPCWADLWTSDVEGSRSFYAEVFGWEPQEPDPDFGGYFTFRRQGTMIAGGMGDMGDMKADNKWKPYLATPDAAKTLSAVQAAGGRTFGPAMPVADMGVQGVIADPTGAGLGVWQAGTWPGFSVVEEDGSPSWFELHTGAYERALDFYRTVFGYDVVTASDDEHFRYSLLRLPGTQTDVAGVVDDSARLAADAGNWVIYWDATDVDSAVAKAEHNGGTVLMPAQDTPYGRIAFVADPTGCQFGLRHA